MKEHVLSLNDFNTPKVFETEDSGYILIIRLLLLEPGKFQSHPKMGLGLKSRYRYNNDSNFLASLRQDIQNQLEAYLPELATTDITLTMKNNILGIVIDTADGSYVLAYNSETTDIEAGASYVLENL